jgi:hypothetical protein
LLETADELIEVLDRLAGEGSWPAGDPMFLPRFRHDARRIFNGY